MVRSTIALIAFETDVTLGIIHAFVSDYWLALVFEMYSTIIMIRIEFWTVFSILLRHAFQVTILLVAIVVAGGNRIRSQSRYIRSGGLNNATRNRHQQVLDRTVHDRFRIALDQNDFCITLHWWY